MKRSPKYIIEEQNKTIKKIKEQILHYASMINGSFNFPSGKIKTKLGSKRDLLNKFMVEFGLQGTPRTRLMWLLSTAMKELVAEGLMFRRRNTREYKRVTGSVLYFTTMFAYADSEDKLKTVSERLGEIVSEYNQEQFVSDIIAPPVDNSNENNSQDNFYYHKSSQPSLVGKEVIIDKDGEREKRTYKVRTKNGEQEFSFSSDNAGWDNMYWEKIRDIINLNGSKELKEEVTNMEDIKEPEKKLVKEYAIFSDILDAIALLNMKGFEKFQILTVEGGYLNDGNFSDRDELNNKVKIGDKIFGMDFMVTVLG